MTVNSMQVCFVCCEYPPGRHGGHGTFTQVLSRALVRAGHQVRVIGLYPADHQLPAYEEDQGVRVWRIRQPKIRVGWVWGRYQLYKQICMWADNGEIDLVELNDWQGFAAGWPSLPIPVIVRLNGSASYFAAEMGQKPRRRTFWLERASLRRADSWCSVSEYTAEKTKAVFQLASNADAILYNPVESNPQAAFEERSQHEVVFSGTLTEKKGVVSLIKAWPKVLEQTSGQARLHMYGKDGTAPGGRSMISMLSSMLQPEQLRTVEFHGHTCRERLLNALSNARMAVFPSFAEAFAIAPLESMSTGCPTICTSRGAAPELIRDGIDGLLIDPDDPSTIADAVTRLWNDDNLARTLGDAGRMTVQSRFTDDLLLHRNLEFFHRCMPQAIPFARTVARPRVEMEPVTGTRRAFES